MGDGSTTLTPVTQAKTPPRVLLVGKDCRPHSLMPLATLSWQECMSALHLGRVSTLTKGELFEVRTPTERFPLPEVVQLIRANTLPSWIVDAPAACTMENIFRRDLKTCAITGRLLRRGKGVPQEIQASIDHWHTPQSKGGKIEWGNVLTLNAALNNLKADLPLDEFEKIAGPPRVTPWTPTNKELFLLSLADAEHGVFHPSWGEFIMPMAHEITDSVKKVLDAFERTFALEKAFST